MDTEDKKYTNTISSIQIFMFQEFLENMHSSEKTICKNMDTYVTSWEETCLTTKKLIFRLQWILHLKLLFHTPFVEFENMHYFGNNQPNRTTDVGENGPLKSVFWLSFSQYRCFSRKKLKNSNGFSVAGLQSLCYPNIPIWVMLLKTCA